MLESATPAATGALTEEIDELLQAGRTEYLAYTAVVVIQGVTADGDVSYSLLAPGGLAAGEARTIVGHAALTMPAPRPNFD